MTSAPIRVMLLQKEVAVRPGGALA